MKLSVLSEAQALKGFDSEHGLSFFLDVDGKKILFDTGASGIFRNNALKLGIDLNEVDAIVLSHGHWDHGNGLQHISGKTLICHPACFQKRYRKAGGENIGLVLSKKEIEKRFQLQTSAEPFQITEHLWFLGEIPRLINFERRETNYILEDGSPDLIPDDSGLACLTDRGLVVISGCAHSGICNMTEHAKEISGVNRVVNVIGGFHLRSLNDQTRNTVRWFRDAGISGVQASHCTMDEALEHFIREFKSSSVKAGESYRF